MAPATPSHLVVSGCQAMTGCAWPWGMESLLADPPHRTAPSRAAKTLAREHFSAAAIVFHYESIYRQVLAG